MRAAAIAIVLGSVVLGSTGCGDTGNGDPCNSASPPLECGLTCDPQPGAPVTCPAGAYCAPDGLCTQDCTPGGGECGANAHCTVDGRCEPDEQCVNLACFQTECPAGQTTSVSGTVFAPNGTLPLYNVTVYVPNAPTEPIPQTLGCDRCSDVLSGSPLVQTTTDTFGNFTLTNVPATGDVPLVIQVGKWRRQVTIPAVPACVDTALDAGMTSLPRNKSEGDIPRMALSTGGADALECLLRKIGLDDAELTAQGGTGRVHLYAGNAGTDQFDAANGGGAMASSTALWEDADSLSNYDVVFLSCEGGQNLGAKPPAARAGMKEYADLGGRVFASHWHNVWLDSGPAPWPSTITRVDLADLNDITADINQTFTQGANLAQWLVNVGASLTLGQIDIHAAQHTVSTVSSAMVERLIYKDVTANGEASTQYMSFTTPLEAAPDMRCGRVVFSDIHVSSGDRSNASLAFPSGGCTTDVTDLTPQEKVLAFMIFDIAACIPEIIE